MLNRFQSDAVYTAIDENGNDKCIFIMEIPREIFSKHKQKNEAECLTANAIRSVFYEPGIGAKSRRSKLGSAEGRREAYRVGAENRW